MAVSPAQSIEAEQEGDKQRLEQVCVGSNGEQPLEKPACDKVKRGVLYIY